MSIFLSKFFENKKGVKVRIGGRIRGNARSKFKK